jgi:ankyrin repeat protein
LWAAAKGHAVVVKLLLEKGAELESTDENCQTPLLWAAATKEEWLSTNSEHKAVVKLLLKNNCIDVNTKNTNNQTPLSWAAGEGHYARVELLLA